jgi:hypothetical protein
MTPHDNEISIVIKARNEQLIKIIGSLEFRVELSALDSLARRARIKDFLQSFFLETAQEIGESTGRQPAAGYVPDMVLADNDEFDRLASAVDLIAMGEGWPGSPALGSSLSVAAPDVLGVLSAPGTWIFLSATAGIVGNRADAILVRLMKLLGAGSHLNGEASRALIRELATASVERRFREQIFRDLPPGHPIVAQMTDSLVLGDIENLGQHERRIQVSGAGFSTTVTFRWGSDSEQVIEVGPIYFTSRGRTNARKVGQC